MKHHILVLSDVGHHGPALVKLVEGGGAAAVSLVHGPTEVRKRLGDHSVSLVVVDLTDDSPWARVPLREWCVQAPHFSVLAVVSGESAAISALRDGAWEALVDNSNLAALLGSHVRLGLRRTELLRKVNSARSCLQGVTQVGLPSAAIAKVQDAITELSRLLDELSRPTEMGATPSFSPAPDFPAAHSQGRPTPPPTMGLATRGKVLIIDDSPLTLTLVAQRLKEASYEVVTSATALCAPLVMKERPDLILMDVEMPGLRGDTCAKIFVGNQNVTSGAALVLHSDLPETNLAGLAEKASVDGYISKHLSVPAFLGQVRHFIDLARARRALP